MTGISQPQRSHKPSIKYGCDPLDGASFELADFHCEDYVPKSSDNEEHSSKISEPSCPEMMCTGDLISAVGQIWNFATCPLSFFHPRTSWKCNNGDFQKGNIFCYSAENGNDRPYNSVKVQHKSVNSQNTGQSTPGLLDNNSLKVYQKKSFFESFSGSHSYSSLWTLLDDNMPLESWKEKDLATTRFSYNLGGIYGWMSEIILIRPKPEVFCTQFGDRRTGVCSIGDGKTSPASFCISGNRTTPTNKLTIESSAHTELKKSINPLSSQNEKSSMNTETSITSLYSSYYLEPLQDTEANENVFKSSSSKLLADYHINLVASGGHACEDNLQKTEDNLHENKKNQTKVVLNMHKSTLEFSAPMQHRHHPVLAKQEHAFAGAMAGVFVSLCLHPVDTIKTVVQSGHADRKSILSTGRSIISERGLTGLYRGIASNITSSAPISAVYTFTYESVKGALVPLLPKDYCSIAHCLSGGCASVATSFIFTPSERIKQQMQVHSYYQSCWRALIGIIAKGGLSSLYAGWGAVLCRNVPHSIIKFYTYESLKQLMLSSLQPNAQLNTLQTLFCGGLAASTASLFTTPFDVVKTRLQTQIPGSMNHHVGVVNTLREIGKHEGLRGLYRGLTPRLVMYMTQGGLFFASYESFKRLFCLEIPHTKDQSI